MHNGLINDGHDEQWVCNIKASGMRLNFHIVVAKVVRSLKSSPVLLISENVR